MSYSSCQTSENGNSYTAKGPIITSFSFRKNRLHTTIRSNVFPYVSLSHSNPSGISKYFFYFFSFFRTNFKTFICIQNFVFSDRYNNNNNNNLSIDFITYYNDLLIYNIIYDHYFSRDERK